MKNLLHEVHFCTYSGMLAGGLHSVIQDWSFNCEKDKKKI